MNNHRWRPLRSLRSLTILFTAVFLLATAGTGWAISLASRRTVRELVDARIGAESRAVMDNPAHATAAGLAARIALSARKRDTGDIGFELLDATGRHLAGNIRLLRRLQPGLSSVDVRDDIAGLSHGRALVRRGAGGLELITVAETEPFDDLDQSRLQIYLVGFGSIILTVMTGLWLFGRLVAGRIRDLRETAAAIVDGDMKSRVSVSGDGGEFDAQALAFNRMLDRIADLIAGLGSVSSDIAHDLRSPLARLRTQLTRIARHVATDSARSEVDTAIAQADELLAMFAAVLRIAEVEGGERRAAFAAIDLGALVRDVGATMGDVATELGYRLEITDAMPAHIRGDRQLLAQALINLIENAFRHTPPGTLIEIAAGTAGSAAQLVVSDNGPGIPADQRTTALRRFGRLDKSRGRSGHGLGLALVEAIVRLHRGAVGLDDAMPGLRITLRLPLG